MALELLSHSCADDGDWEGNRVHRLDFRCLENNMYKPLSYKVTTLCFVPAVDRYEAFAPGRSVPLVSILDKPPGLVALRRSNWPLWTMLAWENGSGRYILTCPRRSRELCRCYGHDR